MWPYGSSILFKLFEQNVGTVRPHFDLPEECQEAEILEKSDIFFIYLKKLWMLQVILGLLIPPYIGALEFKSREELQLMPQTMEEHLDELEDAASDIGMSLSFSDLDEDHVHDVRF